MKTIQLTIPNMKSSHCMVTVSNVVGIISGATMKKVSPGVAEIELSGITKDVVVAAIEKAGYSVTNK